MRYWAVLLLLFWVGGLEALSRSDLYQLVDKYAEGYRKSKHTPPALLVGVIYEDSAGMPAKKIFCYGSDRERISETTLFRIGGVTEVFTATLFAKLVQEGLIKLDDPVQKYLPQGVWMPIFNGTQVRLQDLATHTSGLPEKPRDVKRKKNYTTKEMYDFLNKYRLYRAPGTKYRYSPLGYALLADILSRVMERSWQDAIMQKICNKLDLAHTRALLNVEERKMVALGHNKWGKVIDSVFLESDASVFLGADGLFSSAKDMMNWLAYNLGEVESDLSFLLPIIQEPHCSMGARKDSKICLGWELSYLDQKQSLSQFSKKGKFGGFGVYLAFVKDTKTGVIVMTNSSHSPESIGANILKALNELEE